MRSCVILFGQTQDSRGSDRLIQRFLRDFVSNLGKEMIFGLEFLWSPRLHVCDESHYNSDLTAYFASSQKVGQVEVHLVFHFSHD